MDNSWWSNECQLQIYLRIIFHKLLSKSKSWVEYRRYYYYFFGYDVKTLINNSSIPSLNHILNLSTWHKRTLEILSVNHYLNLPNLWHFLSETAMDQIPTHYLSVFLSVAQLEFFARKWHNPISLPFRRAIVTPLSS